MNIKPNVFLSYSSKDKGVADYIQNGLRNEDIEVVLNSNEFQPGESVFDVIKKKISACDYLIVLLSPNSVKSVWVNKEIDLFLKNEVVSRNITLIPVIISDCNIPFDISHMQYIDIRNNLQEGIDLVIQKIKKIPRIDFARLDYKTFESMVTDLLLRCGFVNLERSILQKKSPNNYVYDIDIKADYLRSDPFGSIINETWIVEVKLYKESRADLKSINQLAHLVNSFPGKCIGLLVTSSHLTSTALNWIEISGLRDRLRVVDGTELKRLLLNNEDLIQKYFID